MLAQLDTMQIASRLSGTQLLVFAVVAVIVQAALHGFLQWLYSNKTRSIVRQTSSDIKSELKENTQVTCQTQEIVNGRMEAMVRKAEEAGYAKGLLAGKAQQKVPTADDIAKALKEQS